MFSPMPMYSKLIPLNLWIQILMLRPLIHLDLSSLQENRYGLICILLQADIQLNTVSFVELFFFLKVYTKFNLWNCKFEDSLGNTQVPGQPELV